MNFKQFTLFTLFSIFFIHCESLNDVELKIPDSEERIAVAAIGEIGGKAKIQFGRSYSVLQSKPTKFEEEFSAMLISDTGDKIPFTIDDKTGVTVTDLQEGVSYQLEFKTEREGTFITEFVDPPTQVKIDSISHSKVTNGHILGRYEAKLHIDKASMESQCYAYQTYYYNKDELLDVRNHNLTSILTTENIFENDSRRLKFTYGDKHNIGWGSDLKDLTSIQVKFYSFSDEICEFYKSDDYYDDIEFIGDIEHSYFPRYSNLPIGYGFFALAAVDSVRFEIEF